MKINPLKEILLEIKKFQSIEALLSWDQETYMPDESGDIRAEHISFLNTLAHQLHTGERFQALLKDYVDLETGSIKNNKANDETKRFLHLVWKDYHTASALPQDFVKEYSLHTSKSQQIWQKARINNDFKMFAPYLEKMIELKKKEAEYYGYKTTPYDALLDNYEPEMTSDKVTAYFYELKEYLVSLVKRIKNSTVHIDETPLNRDFDENKQWDFTLRVIDDMGFSMKKGRQDRSAHPFTTNFHPTDVRITTRTDKNNLKTGLFGTIHETGHGLYEQGIKIEDYGTPFGEAISYGIHESQSRLWENMVGRNSNFWEYYFPILSSLFKESLNDIDLPTFYKMINAVNPSLIRVEADEVTYSLHIILRFDIELMLINGNLRVKDLPDIWNEKMNEYLGITPPDYKTGVLQDIHWSMGYFGYFPTYALGNIYAAMIWNRAQLENPKWTSQFREGNFLSLKKWLNEKVHHIGRRKTAEELIYNITEQSVSAKPFIYYLENKYSGIYNLPRIETK